MRFVLLVVSLLAGFAEAEFLVMNNLPAGQALHCPTSSQATFVPTNRAMLDYSTSRTCASVVTER